MTGADASPSFRTVADRVNAAPATGPLLLTEGATTTKSAGTCGSRPGAVDRLVRYPIGSDSRLITTSGCEDSTVSRHLPSPSPSDPSSPSSPDSSSAAVYVRDAPAGMVVVTSLPGDSPRSSTPAMETSAASSPGLTRRSRLTWLALPPGLKNATRCLPPALGAVSCIAVRNPSLVLTYDSTSMSSSLESCNRQAPWPAPTPSDSPFSALPLSRSSELKWAASPAPMRITSGP